MPSAALAVELAEASGEFQGGTCQGPTASLRGGGRSLTQRLRAFLLAPCSGAQFLESGQRRWVNFCPCHTGKMVSHRPHVLGDQDQPASALLASWKLRLQATLAARPPRGWTLWTLGQNQPCGPRRLGTAQCGHVPMGWPTSPAAGGPLRRAPATCVSRHGFF